MLKVPTISKDLVDYIEKVFSPVLPYTAPDTSPHVISARVHWMEGSQHVVRHLRALYENQQIEDPLNVHQDTEDA